MDLALPKIAYRAAEGAENLYHLPSNIDKHTTVCGIESKNSITDEWLRVLISEMRGHHACPFCFSAFIEMPFDIGVQPDKNDIQTIIETSSETDKMEITNG